MNRHHPALGRFSVYVCLALLCSLALPYHAAGAACSTSPSNMPTGRTLFVADHANNQVVVVDASGSTVTVACTIALGAGTGPSHLAVTPDSSFLLVENDTDGSVRVVTLSTLAMQIISAGALGTTAPMTGNIAVSPDGTFAYLVTLSTGDTVPQLHVISIPSLSVAGPVAVGAVAVTSPQLGVDFVPFAGVPSYTAYIVTEGASYRVTGGTTPAFTALTTAGPTQVSTGTVSVDPLGNFAYAMEASPVATNANVYQIVGTTVAGLTSVTPLCTFAGGSAISNISTVQRAFYTCAGDHFIQAIDATTNSGTAVGHVALVSTTAHPQGITIPYDGLTAYVTADDGTVTEMDSITTTPTNTPAVGLGTGANPIGIVTRPSVLSPLTPANPSVHTGATQQFTTALSFAKNSTLIWSVDGVVGGNATVGTIDAAGLYTAPNAIPAGGTVTIRVTSAELPPISHLYPLTTTATITPSQLAFTTEPVNGTAGTALTAVVVSVEDANGAVVTTDTSSVTITISNPGAFTGLSTTTVGAVAGVATFSNLVPTKPGTGFTLSATDGTLTGATSTPFDVAAGTATDLVFTTSPFTVTAGVCSGAITVQTQDSLGNPSNPSATVSLTLTTSSTGAPPTGFYSDSACTSQITIASIPTTANSLTFYYKDTKAGSPTISPTINSGPVASTAAQIETVNPAAAVAPLVFTNAALNLTAGVCSSAITVQSRDTFGNPSNPSPAETLTLTSSSTTGAFYTNGTCTTSTTSATIPTSASSASFYYRDTAVGTPTITVTGSGAFASTINQGETATFAAANKVVFVQQPSTTTAGAAVSPAVTVQVEDQFNNPVTTDTSSVTITISAGGVLSGTSTTTVAAVAGLATFSNLVPTKTGSYTLSAADGSLTGATSSGFTVNPAAANKLVFGQQPSTTTAGLAISPAVTVQVQDQFNNVVTTDTSNVTITISAGGVLTGTSTSTVAAVAGVATFSNLVPTKTGSYTLSAADGSLTGATSTAFTVNPAAANKLVFAQQPSTTSAGSAISPAVTVQVQDQFNNIVTSDTSNVAIAISAGGVLTGTTTVAAVAGVATFNNLVPTKTGTGFTLSATDGSLTGATSTSFTVNPGAAAKLVFTPQPTGGALGGNTTPFPALTVSVEDASNNVVTPSTASITITSSPANVGGTTTVAAVSGVATFNALQFTVAGAYTLTAASTGLTSATSTQFTLTTSITVNITSAFTSVNIEDLPAGTDTFTGTATPDPNNPSLGVTWAMVSCSGSTTNLAPCGTVAANGAYTPPGVVPASPTFVVQATSVADPSKTKTSGNITIGSTVAVAVVPPTTTPASTVLLEQQYTFTATVTNDPGLKGVNFALICPDVTPCGTLGTVGAPTGSGTSYTVTVAYTAPTTVLATASHATVSATSIADPSKPLGSTTVTITSNISVSVAGTTIASNAVVYGTPGSFAATLTNAASIKTVTWKINCGSSGTNACGTIDAAGNYSTPAVPPGTPTFTVTATSVADPTKSFTTPTYTINGDLLLNDQHASISIASTASSGSGTVSFYGPNAANPGSFTFTCVIHATTGTVTGGTCSFSVPGGGALPNPFASASANGVNPVVVNLSVLRTAGVIPLNPPQGLRGAPVLVSLLACALAFLLFSMFAKNRSSLVRRGYAVTVILCLTLGWLAACNQFKAPGQLPPLVPPTQQAQGTVDVTATPSGGSGFSAQTVSVPFTVN